VDPYIPDGDVPRVEHAVLPLDMLPVTPAGAGLTPADTISVEPRGMPVWEIVEPVPIPSGEVAAMVGVGIAIPLTCAMAAALQMISIGAAAAINDNLMDNLMVNLLQSNSPQRLPRMRRSGMPCCDLTEPVSIRFATISPGASLADI
jgi:hypothetical protein